jgi:VCBS repeat-containing protein
VVPVTGTPYNGVLFNDSDADGSALTAILVSTVATGVLVLNANGSFSYTPVANANGSVTFTYKANDGALDSNVVTVTITITAVNDVPSFTKGVDQSVFQTAPAQTLTAWATSISAGPSNESSQVVDFLVSNDNVGLFSVQPAVSATGTLTFTLVGTTNGSATVTIRIHDNGGTSNGGVDTSAAQTFVIVVDDGYISSSAWSTSFLAGRYLDLTFPAYVPSGSVVTAATFRHSYRSTVSGDTTCYYFEVYSGSTLLATHGSAAAPVSCSGAVYTADVVALPEVNSVAKANSLRLRLFVKNSGGHTSVHRLATLGVAWYLD